MTIEHKPILVQRDPIGALREKMALWSGRGLEIEEVVYILKTSAREILPSQGLSGRCRQLETFTHWCLHDKLERTQLGGEVLVAIAEAVPLHDGPNPAYDSDWLTGVVNQDLSFNLLRLDLLAFFRRFGLPDDLVTTWEGWQRFALPLALEISGRPISMSDTDGNKKLAALRERLRNSPVAPGHTLRNIRLFLVRNLPFQYCWSLETTSGIQIVLAVWFGEREVKASPTPSGWVSPL